MNRTILFDYSSCQPNPLSDIIVVGSGPGATGFLLRLLERRPTVSVTWFEKGPNSLALKWPEFFVDHPGKDRIELTPIPRTGGTHWHSPSFPSQGK